MAERNEGGCVCGAVRYVAHADPERVTVCHCTWCQRRTGSAFGVEAVFRTEQIAIIGDTLLNYRHVSDESGRWLDQEFCSRCGTNIGFTLEAVPGIRTIAAGTFDDPSWINPEKMLVLLCLPALCAKLVKIPDGVEQHEAHFRT